MGLKKNELLLECIKYTCTGILTLAIFAELIGIEIVKIDSVVQEKENWKKFSTNCMVLAYTPRKKYF